MNISFQGEHGAFSSVMAKNLFRDAELLPCRTFTDLFRSVKEKKADAAIVPIENSFTGRIVEPTELLIGSDLEVIGEGKLKIIHCLIAGSGTAIEEIKKIYAHPEALAQCRNFLSTLDCELISWYDGAAAARIIRDTDDSCLIAGRKAAEIYSLNILKDTIQDSEDNTTRFFVAARPGRQDLKDAMYVQEKNLHDANMKTTLLFITRHRPGALFHALGAFSGNSINLTRLESMPSRGRPWEYKFLVDIEGSRDDEDIRSALRVLAEYTNHVKVLGTYRQSRIFE